MSTGIGTRGEEIEIKNFYNGSFVGVGEGGDGSLPGEKSFD